MFGVKVTAGLSRLFNPQTIAVVGGGAWCRSVIRSLKQMGYAGPIWPVHPKATEIEGFLAFDSVASLPAGPDATFIGVNRTTTIDILRELNAVKAGGAVCFAAGFAETEDGGALNEALLDAAGDMSIVGPNCYGFVNALDQVALWPDVHGLVKVDRGVAILTQSSNVALNLSMQHRGLPIGFLGTAGNQAQIGLSQMALHLLHDPRITALGLYIEGVGDLTALQDLMVTAEKLGKPVIALKTGRSEAAQTAAVSHTASMAGSDVGAAALFARLGIVRVASLDAMVEALKHAHLFGRVSQGSMASLSCSGGEASLMSDGGDARGLKFAPLTDAQDAALETVLGPLVTRANPLDYHTFIWNDLDRMSDVYTIMAGGPAALTVIVVDFPRNDRCMTEDWDCVEAAAIAAHKATGKPIALMSSLPESLPEDLANRLMGIGVLPINGMEAGLDALAALYNDDVSDPTRMIAQPATSGQNTVQDESSAKALLRAYDLDIPQSAVADTPQEAAKLAGPLLPVVVKSRGLAHKSESGGVALNLTSCASVEQAAALMDGQSFYVEEMICDGVVEILVSILADPAHGNVLTLGAGGVLTELWQDTQHILVPATEAEIDAALNKLRIAPLLNGYRGKPSVNRDVLIAAILSVQEFVVAHEGRVAEVEINPMIATPTRAVVADALIRGEL